MATTSGTCINRSADGCELHYHPSDNLFTASQPAGTSQTQHLENGGVKSSADNAPSQMAREAGVPSPATTLERKLTAPDVDPGDRASDRGWRRIVRNFTPSWFIITLSTGVISIMLHQLPYNGHWLEIISIIFFVLNVALFVLFLGISVLRYALYPSLVLSVLRHPHQSLFVATMPIGLATLINMVVLVCVPAWGSGLAIFAWVLWWIDLVLAAATCFHLTFIIMSHRRPELAEMTALYFIPILAVVIVATSGALVGGVLPNPTHQLWTLIISYILWGLGTPLSWIIMTIYFLRLTVAKPLKREVIVSLLLPVGPLSLSGFSAISLGKLSRVLLPATDTLPKVERAGDMFYAIGFLLGLVLWGFAIVWFVIAIIMIGLTGGFPFNMGWWGFIFPIGIFTLLTITIGEDLESSFFDVLACILTVVCVIMWLVIAVGTIQRSIRGTMFFAPCLGTDLYLRRVKTKEASSKASKEAV